MTWSAGELYEWLSPAVLGYFRGRGAHDPADLTGDVFVSVTRGLPRFRGDAQALRRWVFTIAHHRMVDEYRRSGHERHVWTADVPDMPEGNAEIVDHDLLAALHRLTDDQREVVVLRFICDLALADVAKIVGKRTGAVKMLQARGLEALRGMLDS